MTIIIIIILEDLTVYNMPLSVQAAITKYCRTSDFYTTGFNFFVVLEVGRPRSGSQYGWSSGESPLLDCRHLLVSSPD